MGRNPADREGEKIKPKRPAVSAILFQKILGLLLIVIVFVNVANATGRYFLGKGIIGADEIMVFAMVFIVMAGSVFALAARSHISINLLPSQLTGKKLVLLHLFYDLVTAFVSGYAALASWSYVSRIARLGATSMSLGIPMVIPHSAIFLGFSIMFAVALFLIIQDTRHLMHLSSAQPGESS